MTQTLKHRAAYVATDESCDKSKSSRKRRMRAAAARVRLPQHDAKFKNRRETPLIVEALRKPAFHFKDERLNDSPMQHDEASLGS